MTISLKKKVKQDSIKSNDVNIMAKSSLSVVNHLTIQGRNFQEIMILKTMTLRNRNFVNFLAPIQNFKSEWLKTQYRQNINKIKDEFH